MDSAQTREHGRAALVTLKLSALLGSGAVSKCGGGGQVALVALYIGTFVAVSGYLGSVHPFLNFLLQSVQFTMNDVALRGREQITHSEHLRSQPL